MPKQLRLPRRRSITRPKSRLEKKEMSKPRRNLQRPLSLKKKPQS